MIIHAEKKAPGIILLTVFVCYVSCKTRFSQSNHGHPSSTKTVHHRPIVIPKVACSGSYLCGTIKHGNYKQEECIHPSGVCDGRVDCSNGIDEKECDPKCSLTGVIRCKDPRVCARRCDGVRECPDGEDEKKCPPKCALNGLILCKDQLTCAKPCDHIRQCPDGDDEDFCPKECFCEEGNFLCESDDTCIHAMNRCDGENDCLLGEDEENCRVCCPDEHYLCDDKKTCVPNTKMCDGMNDCPNKDDETSCPSPCLCQEGQYFCDRLPGMDQICVEAAQTCETDFFDPPLDCPLGDDELALGDWCPI